MTHQVRRLALIMTIAMLMLLGNLAVTQVLEAESLRLHQDNTRLLLEEYGLTRGVRAGDFVRSGETGLGGVLPTNTGGGQLSGFYLQGMTPLSSAP